MGDVAVAVGMDGVLMTLDNQGRVVPVRPLVMSRPTEILTPERQAETRRWAEAMGDDVADRRTAEQVLKIRVRLDGERSGRLWYPELPAEPDPADRRIMGERFHVESLMLDPIDSADQRIIAWMPVEYMEAARAGGKLPDAPEAVPDAPCDTWLISPASLPAALRNGAQNGKGKARGREMVYDFEEVP